MATIARPAHPALPRRPAVWRRTLDVVDSRLGLDSLRYEVPEHANNLAWSLGGITAATFLLLVVTGVFLAQFYVPTPEAANSSVRDMVNGVTLGSFVRGVHFWGAQAMYITAGLHLLRVFLTGSYKKPREANWLIGVAMFALVIGGLFTGTVLKWDQEGFEALAHNLDVAKVLGGTGFWFSSDLANNVPIIVRLYGAHVGIIPGLMFLLMVVHFLLVKRHRISPAPKNPDAVGEAAGPFTHHLRRVGIFALIVFGVIGLIALLFPPGVGPVPVEGIEVTKPPWPFLWFFGLEDFVGLNGILYGAIAFFAVLVALPFVDRGRERHWRRRPIAMGGLVVVLGLLVYLSINAATAGMTSHLGG